MKNKKNTSKVQLLWEGKEEALLQHLTPTTQVYNIPSEIEGNEVHCVDNLDFLKLNQERLRGKVKCIYIDPPYNTGKDFIYKDKRHKRGECRHSQWLSFMLPRLKLARDLLREDGVIFVSIDDNEQANLKLLMDEVFGEEEFVANVIWQKKFSPQNDATYFSDMHDYILCFAKNKKQNKADFGWNRILLPRNEEKDKRFSNPDNDPRGEWSSGDFTGEGITANCVYEIISLNGKIFLPPEGKRWVYNYDNYLKLKEENRFYFGKDGNAFPRIKRFKSEIQDGLVPNTIWFYEEAGHTQGGKQEVNKIFDGVSVFDYPKPVSLIKRILQISTTENDLVLDFFAGSGTTGQAVMELNHETKQPRNFILVQWNEEIAEGKEAHKFCVENGLEPVISSITIERLRRAGAKYTGDTSFKVYKYNLHQ